MGSTVDYWVDGSRPSRITSSRIERRHLGRLSCCSVPINAVNCRFEPLIVGRDHACPEADADGPKFYEPFAGQDFARSLTEEKEVEIVAFEEIAYLTDEARYEAVNRSISGQKLYPLSGSRIREEFLGRGRDLAAWLTRKEVAAVLADSYPPPDRRRISISRSFARATIRHYKDIPLPALE